MHPSALPLWSGGVCAVSARHLPSVRMGGRWALVSIASSWEEELRSRHANPEMADRLEVTFDDVEEPSPSSEPFEVRHAEAILAFFARTREVGAWVVSCTYGMSRSPAVASVLDLALTGSDEAWLRHRRPNRRVREIMRRVAAEAGLVAATAPGRGGGGM